jgi:hypothetical protein
MRRSAANVGVRRDAVITLVARVDARLTELDRDLYAYWRAHLRDALSRDSETFLRALREIQALLDS